jgi:hypothetical protein
MSAERCSNCGREPENGTPTHWIGCPVPGLAARRAAANECEHDECSKPKKEWSGRGARPKFCADGHK